MRTSTGSYANPVETVYGSVYSSNITNITNGETYYFVVKATNQGGDSEASIEVNAIPKSVPGQPINVTAKAGNGEATISITGPNDNGGSPIIEYIVTSNPGNIIVTGSGTTFKVGGLTNGVTYTFTANAVNVVGKGQASIASNAIIPYQESSEPDSDNNNNSNLTPIAPIKPVEGSVEILVNGKIEAVTATTTKLDNKTIITVSLDGKKLEEKLQKEGQNSTVTIPVKNKTDIVVGKLNGQIIKNMEAKDAILEIKTENITYTLPASQIDIESISAQLGKQVELKDIVVNVKISIEPKEFSKTVEDTANKNNYQLVVKPVEFEISCTNGEKTVEVSRFNAYVERMVELPESIEPNKITTGIVLNPDKTFSHVPTVIKNFNGKYFAKINSLTNSTYAVIWNPKTFTDVEAHWAKDAVNDMGSRLVISGVGGNKYEPDTDITRAEFAAIVVRSLGIMRPGCGIDLFSDVKKDAWYYDAVTIAHEYGIISGYGNGAFGPMDKITREQAISMIARAMKITNLKVELKSEELASLVGKFEDWEKSSDWARDSIAACIKNKIVSGRDEKQIAPQEYITRAEVAVMVRSLLQKSKLI